MPCVVHPVRRARLEAGYREWVGLDLFYFSDRAARERFRRAPLRYLGTLTDPVTLGRFRVTRDAPLWVHAGRAYYFASETSRRAFRDAPDRYATRAGR